MEFEWDPAKAGANVRKHGVSFNEAMDIFGDPRVLVRYDEVHSGAMDRRKAVGFSSKGRLVSVIYRQSGGRVRIISARKAEAREKWAYNQIRG